MFVFMLIKNGSFYKIFLKIFYLAIYLVAGCVTDVDSIVSWLACWQTHIRIYVYVHLYAYASFAFVMYINLFHFYYFYARCMCCILWLVFSGVFVFIIFPLCSLTLVAFEFRNILLFPAFVFSFPKFSFPLFYPLCLFLIILLGNYLLLLDVLCAAFYLYIFLLS